MRLRDYGDCRINHGTCHNIGMIDFRFLVSEVPDVIGNLALWGLGRSSVLLSSRVSGGIEGSFSGFPLGWKIEFLCS
jgi:hypothetical protein